MRRTRRKNRQWRYSSGSLKWRYKSHNDVLWPLQNYGMIFKMRSTSPLTFCNSYKNIVKALPSLWIRHHFQLAFSSKNVFYQRLFYFTSRFCYFYFVVSKFELRVVVVVFTCSFLFSISSSIFYDFRKKISSRIWRKVVTIRWLFYFSFLKFLLNIKVFKNGNTVFLKTSMKMFACKNFVVGIPRSSLSLSFIIRWIRVFKFCFLCSDVSMVEYA